MESTTPKLTRAEQNRINSRKSTGPRTPEGKQRSSENAVKHGIYTSSIVLTGESAEEFMKLLHAYRCQFQPTDAFEGDLIQDLADARWRIYRMKRQETLEWCQATFNASHDPALAEASYEILHEVAHRKSYQTKGSPLEACRRAEARYRRDFDRALKALHEHRKLKSKNEAIAQPAAQPEPPQPQPDPPPPTPQKSRNEATQPSLPTPNFPLDAPQSLRDSIKLMFPEGLNL